MEEQKVNTVTQTPRKYGRVNLAVEAGGNLNGLYKTNSKHIETNGFHAGALVNIGLGDNFALQPGIRYTRKGDKDRRTSSYEGTTIVTDNELKLNYVQLPVNAVYKFGKPGTARFMVGAGPYVSYLASTTNTIKANGTNTEGFDVVNSKSTVTNNNVNTWHAGGGGFIGVQTPNGFYAKAGGEIGYTDIQKNPADINRPDRDYSWQITLGYIIGPKGKTY